MMKFKHLFFLIMMCLVATNIASQNDSETLKFIVEESNKEYTLQNISKDETSDVEHLNNGDFYLRYELYIVRIEYGSKALESWVAHFIPKEENRYWVEDRLEGVEYPFHEVSGQDLWHLTLYPTDTPMEAKGYADESTVYSRLLEYYQTHKSEIKILEDHVE